MNLTISGHHVTVTPALRDHVLAKLGDITKPCVVAAVTLTVERRGGEEEGRQKACIRFVPKRGVERHLECACEDMYAAVDGLKDKVTRDMRKCLMWHNPRRKVPHKRMSDDN